MSNLPQVHIFTSNGDLAKAWYCYFYFISPQGKKKRYRFKGGVNSFQDKKSRMQALMVLRERLVQQLEEGWTPDGDTSNPNLLETDGQRFIERTYGMNRTKTYQSYKTSVTKFTEFATERWGKLFTKEVKSNMVRAFLDELAALGRSPKTINNYQTDLVTFFNWAEVETNPAKGKRHKASKRKRDIVITTQELSNVIKHLEGIGQTGYTDFILLLYYTFIRPTELRGLQVRDVNLETMQITVPGSISKNGKTQTVVIPDALYERLVRLNRESPNTYIFSQGMMPGETKLSVNVPNQWWHRHIKRNFDMKAHLYSVKHRGVIDAVEEGINIRALQLQLRHSSLEQTEIYLASMKSANVAAFKVRGQILKPK